MSRKGHSPDEERARYWMERKQCEFQQYMNSPALRREVKETFDFMKVELDANSFAIEMLGMFLFQHLQIDPAVFRTFCETKMKEAAERLKAEQAAKQAGPVA